MKEKFLPKQENENANGRFFWGSYYPLNFWFLKEFGKRAPQDGDFVGVATDPLDPHNKEKWEFLYWVVGPDGVGSIHRTHD